MARAQLVPRAVPQAAHRGRGRASQAPRVVRLPAVPAQSCSQAAMVATPPGRGMAAAEGERPAPMAQVILERARRWSRPAVAAQATLVSEALAAVLLPSLRAGTAQNSKPHLRLGVGAAAEEEALAGTQVITAGVAAAAEQGRAAPAQTVSALSPTRPSIYCHDVGASVGGLY